MPQARCQVEYDCINGESCVQGYCKFTHVLEVEVLFINMFSRDFNEDLIIEASRCRESFKGFNCRTKTFKYVKSSPRYPYSVRFKKIPHGKYLVVAAIDMENSGKIENRDIAGMSIIPAYNPSEDDVEKKEKIIRMQYPYKMISKRASALKRKISFWEVH